MPKLLVIETSPRGDYSVSRTMTRRFVGDWRAAHLDGEVVIRDLAQMELPSINAPWLQAYFTPAEQHDPAMRETLRVSDELVAEVVEADHIVIATPVYNYNIPASLKAWVDHIVRKGITLGLDGQGLLTGKKATVILASGGVYTEGSPVRDRDIATLYLKLILHIIGIDDVTFVAAGNAKSVDLGEATMADFVNSHAGAITLAVAA